LTISHFHNYSFAPSNEYLSTVLLTESVPLQYFISREQNQRYHEKTCQYHITDKLSYTSFTTKSIPDSKEWLSQWILFHIQPQFKYEFFSYILQNLIMKGFEKHFRNKKWRDKNITFQRRHVTIYIINSNNNGDMSSLKRHVFISLLFNLKYFKINSCNVSAEVQKLEFFALTKSSSQCEWHPYCFTKIFKNENTFNDLSIKLPYR